MPVTIALVCPVMLMSPPLAVPPADEAKTLTAAVPPFAASNDVPKVVLPPDPGATGLVLVALLQPPAPPPAILTSSQVAPVGVV